MKLPNKITSYSESSISKFPPILKVLREGEKSPIELYEKAKKDKISIPEFMEVIDALYALGKIDLNGEGKLYYVTRD
ncbi:MAG: hypothetical protein E7222_10070 [Clostridiales bacterium]|nr:hypothetical protein [Clostridiales bacterium]